MPGVAVLTLLLIPFIDRGPMVRLGKRTFAFAFVILGVLAWTGLTTAAVVTTPPNPEENGSSHSRRHRRRSRRGRSCRRRNWRASGYFKKQNCVACHPGAGKKGIGPDLTDHAGRPPQRRLAGSPFQESIFSSARQLHAAG